LKKICRHEDWRFNPGRSIMSTRTVTPIRIALTTRAESTDVLAMYNDGGLIMCNYQCDCNPVQTKFLQRTVYYG